MSPAPLLLMVDDDPDETVILAGAIGSLGRPARHEVLADSLALEERLASGERPDLVLIDLSMPRRDGLATIRALRADHRWDSLPLVVFTSSRSPEDLARAKAIGANQCITKPDSLRQTVAVLRLLLDTYAPA